MRVKTNLTENLSESLFGAPFKGLKGGDTVVYKQYAGMGLKGPEYKEGRGKVNAMLIFPDHVVLNIGGKHGTPQVVDERNFIRKV